MSSLMLLQLTDVLTLGSAPRAAGASAIELRQAARTGRARRARRAHR